MVLVGIREAQETSRNTDAEVAALAEQLRERTAFRYSGDCKCGACQLVPRKLIDDILPHLHRLIAAPGDEARTLADAPKKSPVEAEPMAAEPAQQMMRALTSDEQRMLDNALRASTTEVYAFGPDPALLDKAVEALERVRRWMPPAGQDQLVDEDIRFADAALSDIKGR